MPKEFLFQVFGPGKELRVDFREILFCLVREGMGNFKQLIRINRDL